MHKLIDTTVSVATVALAACAMFLAADRIMQGRATSGQASSSRESSVQRGDDLSRTIGIDFSIADRTAIVVLSSSCRYCTASMPFYKRLLAERDRGTVPARFVAVFASDDMQSEDYLRAHGLAPDATIRLPRQVLAGQIQGTPTLILAGKNGIVQDVWFGLVSEVVENEIIAAALRRVGA